MTKIITKVGTGESARYLLSTHGETKAGRGILRAFPTLCDAQAFARDEGIAPRGASEETRQHWLRLFRLALETCARRAELVRAQWDEFDLEAKVWRLPLAHMPGSHRDVPLSKAATRIIRVMKRAADPDTPRVFHAISDDLCPEVLFSQLMFRLGLRCKGFAQLRNLAITRYEALHGTPAPSTILRALGRTKSKFKKRIGPSSLPPGRQA